MKKKALIRFNNEDELEKEVIYKGNVITYFDNDKKMIVNLDTFEIEREDKEYHSLIKPLENTIIITLKEHNTKFNKDIKIIEKISNNNRFYLKYLLVDENIINEYEIKL